MGDGLLAEGEEETDKAFLGFPLNGVLVLVSVGRNLRARER